MLLFMLTGPYWIDPNGGCVKDAIEVWCDYRNASCHSCVDPVHKVRWCLCYRYCNYSKCNHGNQIQVETKSRDITTDGYYLATGLEDAKPVSVYTTVLIHLP